MLRADILTSRASADQCALILRVGLGAVFVIGGLAKLSRLLDPDAAGGLVALYMGPLGYINAFFADYLFDGPLAGILTPAAFLTTLSAFELVSGLLLIAGLMVRPLALFYGFLLWSFIVALPVSTVPGIEAALQTYTAPAALVQIRDIGLSGMMFVLFNLGPGAFSIDRRLWPGPATGPANWDALGLLLRISVAIVLLVAGAFHGLDHIQTFNTGAWLLLPLSLLLLAGGVGARIAGAGTAAIMLWYMAGKLDIDRTLLANLNGFKRELAFLAACGVLAYVGGGRLFTAAAAWRRAAATATRLGTSARQPGAAKPPAA